MKAIDVNPDDLVVSEEMRRSGSAKQFEERLRSSIEEIGLSEPLKIAFMPSGKFLVVDGTMRLRAIQSIRDSNPGAFPTVPAYVTDYDQRYEIRYQTDIYQDLLPSQLATLVEHLHTAEGVRKIDIARYIGVSPATLRNYTGVGRLMRRSGLFPRVVEMMDLGIVPSSNPFAWQRLTDQGLRRVLTEKFADTGETADEWLERIIAAARQGHVVRYITTHIELVTGSLEQSNANYRTDQEVRSAKRDYGLLEPPPNGRIRVRIAPPKRDVSAAVKRLGLVARESADPILKSAALSLKAYLQ